MRFATVVALLSLAALASPVEAAPPKRPNIVIILADDWGFSDVGSFGGEIRTPNIDALAKAGVRFSNFHVAGSCSPTRAMLQTGVSNHRAGLGNMPETIPPEHVGKPGYDQVLNKRTVTIADLLRASGYRTYLTGKWHLGHTPDRLPHARGYDRAFSMADAGADNFEQKPIEGLYDKANWSENGRPVTLPRNYYSSTFIIDKTIDYIERDRASGKPFLASINFMANHTPVQAPDAYIARYAGMYDAGWTSLRGARAKRAAGLGIVPPGSPLVAMGSTPDWSRLPPEARLAASRAMEAYGGMAEAMDAEIGRLIAHLKKTGDFENTVFVFLSDNGSEALDPMATFASRMNTRYYYDTSYAAIGRRGSFTAVGPGWASASASPLRGYKFTAYEGGLRVPLIIAWPGNPKLRADTIVPAFSHVIDIAPSLLAMAGVAPSAGFSADGMEAMTGRSLVPLLDGSAAAVRRADEPLGYELSGNAALFRGDYKLVKNLPPAGDGRWKLYNIATDPGETRDLSAAEPALLATMRRDYDAFAKADQVLPMPEGYTAGEQITRNAMRTVLLPKLKVAGAWLALALGAIAALIWWRRRARPV